MLLWTEWTAEGLDVLAKLVLEGMYCAEVKPNVLATIEYPSLLVVLFYQVFIGFVFVSYVVWVLERRSRVSFIALLPPEERTQILIRPLPGYLVGLHVVLFFVSFAVSWRIFSDLAAGIAPWVL